MGRSGVCVEGEGIEGMTASEGKRRSVNGDGTAWWGRRWGGAEAVKDEQGG